MYLLDTCIVAAFQQAGELAALVEVASAAPVALVEEVFDELTRHVSGRSRASSEEIDRVLRPAVQVIGIGIDSPAAHTLAQLRATRSKTDDLGEHASIALCSHDLGLVFVSHDRRAVFEAVEAVAPRVLTLHPFLREVTEKGALTRATAQRAAAAIQNAKAAKKQAWPLAPTWWSPWTAGT
jgi:hypothetical protein